jgi:hypothetical protein
MPVSLVTIPDFDLQQIQRGERVVVPFRPASPDAARSVRRKPAWLPSARGLEFRRAVSSAPYGPAAAGAPLHRHRAAWRVLLPTATTTPQLRPPRLRAAKLLQLPLQLHDWFGDGQCAFAIHYQSPLGD